MTTSINIHQATKVTISSEIETRDDDTEYTVITVNIHTDDGSIPSESINVFSNDPIEFEVIEDD